MRTLLTLLAGCISLALGAAETPPAPGTPKDFRLPPKVTRALANGLQVTYIEYGEIPKVTVSAVTRVGNLNEGTDTWLADITGEMLKEGAGPRSATQMAEDAAAMGGSVGVGVGPDETSVSMDVLTENGPNVLRIYTDGRKHLDDQWATYTGDSVGHWEGDTLVFTTVALKGFRDKDVILDRTGLVLSDQSRATTRIRKIDPKTIQVEMTIEDPKALTKPWVVTKQFQKMPVGTRVYDYGCAENNRNPADVETGKTLILGPDGKPLNK